MARVPLKVNDFPGTGIDGAIGVIIGTMGVTTLKVPVETTTAVLLASRITTVCDPVARPGLAKVNFVEDTEKPAGREPKVPASSR